MQRIPMLVEVMQKNASTFRYIEQWTKENPHFPINQTRTKIFKSQVIVFRQNSLNQGSKFSILIKSALDKV